MNSYCLRLGQELIAKTFTLVKKFKSAKRTGKLQEVLFRMCKHLESVTMILILKNISFVRVELLLFDFAFNKF